MAGNKFLSKQNELAAYQDAEIYGVVLCSACDGHGTITEHDEDSPCEHCNGTGRIRRGVSIKVSDRPYKGGAC